MGGPSVTELPEIVVNLLRVPVPYTAIQVEAGQVRELDAAAVSEVMRAIPSAHVQANSRGETLVYMRNAGERQVAVFLDGALLNIPWDNRIDLDLLPAPMIGGISVVQGVVPVEFGANVMGGAVNLISPAWNGPGRTTVEGQVGSEVRIQGSLAYHGSSGPWRYAGGLSYAAIDGRSLPAGADLPFSQSDPRLRTNSDSRMASVSGRVAHGFPEGSELGLSFFHVGGEKGVPPEGHLDPAVSRVRFWRYPVYRNTTGILSGQGTLGDGSEWRGAAWVNSFAQTIDSYTSDAYDALDAREVGGDLTIGARFTGQKAFGRSTLKAALNGLASEHVQQDLDLEPDGQPVAGQEFPTLRYRQAILSGGLEYAAKPLEELTVTAGASVDAMLPLATGDKPGIAPFTTFGATLGAFWRLPEDWHLRASAGRKARFPTMRELFGESLNRFLINPDLHPESAILAELGAGLSLERFQFEVVPFAMFTSNTIDQHAVLVPGESKPRRQRINLKGSRILGVEVSGSASPLPDLSVQAHFTWSQARRLQEAPTDPLLLAEKPEAVGRILAAYGAPTGATGQAEAVYTAGAYSVDGNDTFVPLPRSLVVNLRAGYRFALPGDGAAEVFVRVNNVGDALEVQQLGLPSAGRTIQGGVVANF